MWNPIEEEKLFLKLFMVMLLVSVIACKGKQLEVETVSAPISQDNTIQTLWDFDDSRIATLPPGWQITATNQKGPLATWQVVRDTSAPSGDQVLSLTSPNHHSGGTFNICWLDSSTFLNGEINVRFKAISGVEDQGGGVIWRARDKNNYYIARFNPLEDNFRIYYVRDGSRRQLADARITLPAGEWHSLKIIQTGNQFTAYLNGKLLIQKTDEHFPNPGSVGLWTKADAATAFDDLVIYSVSK